MLLASQYYRPPFPQIEHWRTDLRDIRDAGLDAVNLWATWAWIEPRPGHYVYDDFDRIVEEAAACDLQVIITTVAELQPYWIPRVIPDSAYVDHLGRRLTSSTLSYSHVGLSPGGCWDHPAVAERIGAFQEDIGAHFAGAQNLLAWDCWNEFRGPVQADGYVCHCDHTQQSFRDWLIGRYGDLDGLNAAWLRRYTDRADVRVPKLPQHSWTESMEYQRFLAWRSAEHATFRADRLRRGDPGHPVLGHSVVLSPIMVGGESPYEQGLSRGNDWEMSQRLDAFGISNFPAWFATRPPEYGVRVESGRSAAADRPFWICELQGGSSRNGLGVMNPVPAELQQSWIWAGFGRGAKAISFWCWRDEVFGRESSGFGVVGSDGHAADRVAALRRTTGVLHEHEDLLDRYRPDRARAAVLFDPANHQLDWAANGNPCTSSAGSVSGYLLALERLQTPYDVLAASHLADLSGYGFIALPWAMIVRPAVARALLDWVHAGGTLLAESELDAYDELGLYRYPQDRPFATALGVTGQGRRPVADGEVCEFTLDGATGTLATHTWIEPLYVAPPADVLSASAAGPVLVRRRVGSGSVIVAGTHLALAYLENRTSGFEDFLGTLIRSSDAETPVRCSASDGEMVQWRTGCSGTQRLLFVTNHGQQVDATFTAPADLFAAEVAGDLLTGTQHEITEIDRHRGFTVRLGAGSSAVLLLG